MGVVVPTERQGDALDRDAIQLASVAIRLLDLADREECIADLPPVARAQGVHEGQPSGRTHETGDSGHSV